MNKVYQFILSALCEQVRDYSDALLFLPKDLNNIPCVNMLDSDSIQIFLEQTRIQQELSNVHAEQAAVRQLCEISAELLQMQQKAPTYAQSVRSESQAEAPTSMVCTSRARKTSLDAPRDSGASGFNSVAAGDGEKSPHSRRYTVDSEGYMTRIPKVTRQNSTTVPQAARMQRPMVTGLKVPSKLKPTVNEVRIFATRFSPDESVEDLKSYILETAGVDCIVERIQARTTRYASFLITASRRHEKVLLDPNTWEEGVQVRHFYGHLKNTTKPMINEL